MPTTPKTNTEFEDHHVRNAGPLLHKLVKPNLLKRTYNYLQNN